MLKKKKVQRLLIRLYSTPQYFFDDISKYHTGGWNHAIEAIAENLDIDITEAKEMFKKCFKG